MLVVGGGRGKLTILVWRNKELFAVTSSRAERYSKDMRHDGGSVGGKGTWDLKCSTRKRVSIEVHLS